MRSLLNEVWARQRFQLGRRSTQLLILALFIAANAYGWKILEGNLSFSWVFGIVPLADPFATAQILAAGFAVAQEVLIGAAIVTLFYAVIGGRSFCSWVCPMNIVTDVAYWLRRKTKMFDLVHEYAMTRAIRFWVVGVALLLSFLMGISAFEFISPISMLHRGLIFGMGLGWAAVLTVFTFDLFILQHGFCGHICPLGGFYSLISRYSLVRVNHDAAKCTECMDCLQVCPERQVLSMVGKRSEPVLAGECTNCGRCVEACADDALGFGSRFGQPATLTRGA